MATEDLLGRLKPALADRYVIKHELGAGGMATVYLADDVRHGRQVALKLLRPELGAVLGGERFLREIHIAAGLNHPHILALHDSGEVDGLLYYVMPYVAGESLRQRLERETQLSIEETIELARQVAGALDYAHRQGVIHRDIKPENILLQEGEAMVADFGIARAVRVAGGERITETGLSLGTPHYMSPEQASGNQDLDSRSDVYALACVMYEMLAGEPPFTGPTSPAIIARQLVDPVPSLCTVRPSVSEELERAIEKALAKVPADRYHTAGAFVDAAGAAAQVQVVPTRERKISRRRTWPRGWRFWVPVALAAAAAIIAGVLSVPRGNRAADMSRLAVLPCANRMGDSEQDYMAAGVHDEVVGGLGRIAAVEVRGRSSVMRYRETTMSPPEIAGELGVGALVECSVYRAGSDSVRVTASLLDAPGDRQVWSDAYQRATAEVFLLGSDIARGVAEALNADVTPTESAAVAARQTVSQEALTHYHRGRYLMMSWTREGILNGIEHFERAIALDSNFALAYTGLAEAIIARGDVVAVGDIRPVDYMPQVRGLVQTALDLDPDLADAHRVLSQIKWVYDYDYAGAEREARLATELDPTSAAAWDNYGWSLSTVGMGRHGEGIVAFQRAIELDPAAPWILHDLGAMQYLAREYREALQTLTTGIELDPNRQISYNLAGDAHLLLGNYDEAIRFHEQAVAVEDDPHPLTLGVLGRAYARVGNSEAALRILGELVEMREQRHVPPRAFASVYAGLDSLDTAMDWLIRAAETRDPWLQWEVRNPLNDNLRNHPQYPELLRLMRMEP
jgi:serine/threonine-protein kinase